MPKRKTREDFIADAKSVHGDLYDYSKVEYVNRDTPVRIICKEHDEFLQKPNNHIHKGGCGCPKCGKIKSSERSARHNLKLLSSL